MSSSFSEADEHADPLEFHEFSTPATQGGSLSSAASQMSTATSSSTMVDDMLETGEMAPDASTTLHFWNVKFYAPYFDVDTQAVGARTAAAVLPFSDKFLERIGDKPDIYGPFWGVTTLVFLMAATGNFASYLNWISVMGSSPWSSDFTKVSFGAATLYSYVGLVPLIASQSLHYAGVRGIGYLPLVCVYGYALAAYVPASLLAILPYEWIQWVALGGACALSSGFIFRTVRYAIDSSTCNEKLARTMLFVMIASHVALGVSFKLYFFDNPVESLFDHA
jgi:hypothetical protein